MAKWSFANAHVGKGRFGTYVSTSQRLSTVANGPDVEKVCSAVASRYAYQLSFMRGVMQTEPIVDTIHGKWRIHSRVTVRDTGIYFKDDDGRGGYRRRAWRAQVRDAMSKVVPTMPGYITW